jgi:hypothetical protein
MEVATMDESTTEEEILEPQSDVEDSADQDDEEEVTPAPLFAIYVPEFLPTYCLSTLSFVEQNKELLVQDWLTPGLIAEIDALSPCTFEIDNTQDNKRDATAFQSKIAKIFPVGRVFASFKQLDQAADMFLSAWAVKKTHHSKSIQCAYSVPHDKRNRKHIDVTKRRKLDTTLKSVYKCPFSIRYSFVAYCKNPKTKKPDIFYKVKITNVNFEHTCQLTTIFHRQAMQKSGGFQPNLNGLNDIIALLRLKPNLPTEVLRPLLLKYLPHYKATDTQFLINFRRRARHWLITHGDKELTMEQARFLSAKRPTASDEFLLDDDPMQRQNLTALLRTCMQEGNGTWDALLYLDQMKKQNPGFDYRVKYDGFGRPEGLCWMLPEMRCDLLRFGNCLFLDSQKRQYNTQGWPYIGPVVKDSEMKVRCVAESIIVEESHRMYVWVTEMLAEMEPRFKLASIKLIFGDQALTDQILVDLGIHDTCTLRGDYHHLINEVWPHTFGTYLYSQIRGDLDRMLLGTEEEWKNSYHSAKRLLLHDAEKYSALEAIYKKPSHFAGWFLRNIEGNLFVNGSVPAEQNHSSVAAHLGAGASWSVVEHVVKLHERQIHLTGVRRQADQKSFVSTGKYKSKYRDQPGHDDETAKKQFSRWAYKHLYHPEFLASRRLQYKVHEHMVYVWPKGKEQSCEDLVAFNTTEKCRCSRRVGFVFQCRHELVVDGKLNVEKYARRWLNRRTFNATMTEADFQLPLYTTPVPNPSTTPLFLGGPEPDTKFNDDDNSFSNDNEILDLDDDDLDESEDVTLSALGGKKPHLTYQYVAEKATNLVRLAQSDPSKLASLCLHLEQLNRRLQNGQSIAECSFDLSLPVVAGNNASLPVMGTLKSSNNAVRHRRLQSRFELRNSHIAKKSHSSKDVDHLPPARTRTKACTLCKCGGHQRRSCPKILCFKSAPFEMGKDNQRRLELSSGLTNMGRFKNDRRDPVTDQRVVSLTTPGRMTGVVIHQRLFVNYPSSSKLCVECSILVELGDLHPTFTNSLFSVESIAAYVNRSKTQVIVCELEAGIPEGLESMGFPMINSQPVLEHQSQNQQLGYGYGPVSQQDLMGYGISNNGQECNL